jgi:hypothetical protein
MAQNGSITLTVLICALLGANTVAVRAGDSGQTLVAAHTQASGDEKAGSEDRGNDRVEAQERGGGQKKEKTPEEVMQARFPQPVRVGHLTGLPVLDFDDSTIGYVQRVVRTPDGKIQLIVPYGKWFGWARDWWPFTVGRRPVAVPIETVAILALQIDALDMTRSDFDKASTWIAGRDQPLPPDEMVKIAIARR